MQFTNDFNLNLPADEAYELLLDLDRVVPCIPGATLSPPTAEAPREVTVHVRLGPIKLTYVGTISIVEQEDTIRRAVLRAEAREERGHGTARADISMTVKSIGDAACAVETLAHMQLSGRAAQTGQGLVRDLARRMITEMAECLDSRYSRTGDGSSVEQATVTDGSGAATSEPIRGGALLRSILWQRSRRLALVKRRRRQKGEGNDVL